MLNAETVMCSHTGKLVDSIWAHFMTEEKKICDCKDKEVFIHLKNTIESICRRGNVPLKDVLDYMYEQIRESSLTCFEMFVKEHLNIEEIRNSLEVRLDFGRALEKVGNGRELSPLIGWAFYKEDIRDLAKLHKAGKYCEKIEDLLTDCNFHRECGDFINGRYDKYLNL